MKKMIAMLIASALVAGALWAYSAQAPAQPSHPAQEEELEDFVPSEKVPADSSVSFPVDI